MKILSPSFSSDCLCPSFGKGSVAPEELTYPLVLVTFHRRCKDFPPAVSAVDVSRPQLGFLPVPEVVEQEEQMVI
jgi:hypothetical protein